MKDEVRLETVVGVRPTGVVRRRATVRDLPRVVPEACGVVWKIIKANSIAGAGRHIALYLDGAINLEVGVELATPCEDHGELVCSSIPAGTVATATHFGPYQQLSIVHQAIRDWCTTHGHTLAGPSWELYGHWDQSWNDDPSKIRTDVYYLLKADD